MSDHEHDPLRGTLSRAFDHMARTLESVNKARKLLDAASDIAIEAIDEANERGVDWFPIYQESLGERGLCVLHSMEVPLRDKADELPPEVAAAVDIIHEYSPTGRTCRGFRDAIKAGYTLSEGGIGYTAVRDAADYMAGREGDQ